MTLEVKDGFEFKTELFLNGENVLEIIDFVTKKKLFHLGLVDNHYFLIV